MPTSKRPYLLPEPLTCSSDRVKDGVAMELVEEYIKKHERRMPRYQYLENLYKGEAGPAGPKGDKGDTGDAGSKGDKGDAGIIVSATAPASPVVGQLWQSAAGQPIKRWDGSKWVIHYLSVENLKVESLSALSANLGTVTAGKIQNGNSSGYVIIDLNRLAEFQIG